MKDTNFFKVLSANTGEKEKDYKESSNDSKVIILNTTLFAYKLRILSFKASFNRSQYMWIQVYVDINHRTTVLEPVKTYSIL